MRRAGGQGPSALRMGELCSTLCLLVLIRSWCGCVVAQCNSIVPETLLDTLIRRRAGHCAPWEHIRIRPTRHCALQRGALEKSSNALTVGGVGAAAALSHIGHGASVQRECPSGVVEIVVERRVNRPSKCSMLI